MTLHSPWLDEYFKRVRRISFIDSSGCKSMICEAKVCRDDHVCYMSILDSDMPGFRIGHSSVIDRGEKGFKSDEGLVSRCYGLDAYVAEYGDWDFFTDMFEALYQIMDENDDSVVFKRCGDIVIGKYAVGPRDDCWWGENVIRILDALIDSWGSGLPFAVGTSHEGPDVFVFSEKGQGVMHVIELEHSRSWKAKTVNIRFDDFRDSFMLGIKRFVRHPPRKPETFGQEYTERLRGKIKRRIKAYEKARERYGRTL